ncbi:transmembrane signal receptor [Lithospermum erythrorhizon]|uniref:Transmembrane signal receptor n=1 Tax=Lithospermum erythrorhizon TaxID=34254 RepID=A0AAV3S2M8_LITER
MTSDHIFLSQKKYATEIIEKAGMSSCKPSSTPVDCKAKLSRSFGNSYHNPTEYRSLAGALQYLTLTRPDISYVVQQICLFMHNPHADWGDCPDTRRSTSGYCVYLGDNLISWSAKRQPTLSRSSTEAEYRGVANVVFESCWIRNLFLELHFPISSATMVHCNNVSVVYLSGNPVQHQRTKHIEMDIHFVCEKLLEDKFV